MGHVVPSVSEILVSCTSISDFKDDQEAIHFYSRLDNYAMFCDVLASLGPEAFMLNNMYRTPILSVEDQFFLTLLIDSRASML